MYDKKGDVFTAMKIGLFEYFYFQIQNLILVEWKDKLYLQGLIRFECISGLFHCQNSPTVQCPPLCVCVNSLEFSLRLITLCPQKPLRGSFCEFRRAGAKSRTGLPMFPWEDDLSSM